MDFSKISFILNETSLTAVQRLINKQLSNQPETLKSVKHLQGKSCLFYMSEINLNLLCVISGDKFVLSLEDSVVDATAQIKAHPLSILKLFLAEDGIGFLSEESIMVNGQAQLIISLQKILRSLAIDWQEELKNMFGYILVKDFISYCAKTHKDINANQESNKNASVDLIESLTPLTNSGYNSVLNRVNSCTRKIKGLIAKCMLLEGKLNSRNL